MKSATEILREHGLNPPSDAPGRYYTTCPKCSAARSKAHRQNKVLGITIDSKGVSLGCNHCGWTGGAYYNGKANGQAGDAAGIVAIYDYTDENGELLFQVVRKAGKKFVQRRPNGNGGWIWKDVRKVPYRLTENRGDGCRPSGPDRRGREGRERRMADRSAGDVQPRWRR